MPAREAIALAIQRFLEMDTMCDAYLAEADAILADETVRQELAATSPRTTIKGQDMRDHKNVYPGFELKYDNDGYPDLPKEPTITISRAQHEALLRALRQISEGQGDLISRDIARVALRAAGIQIEGE
jgi:hypothetical protein